MKRQLAEDLFLMVLQLRKDFLEFGLVKDIAGGDRPGLTQLALGGEGESREDHFGKRVLRAFQNVHGIRDGVRVMVIRRDGVELCVKITSMAVLLTDAIPSRLNLHSIGNLSGFRAQQTVQGKLR